MSRPLVALALIILLASGVGVSVIGNWRTEQNTETYANALYSKSLDDFLGREVVVLEDDCSPVYSSVLEVEKQNPLFSTVNGWLEDLNRLDSTQERLEWFSNQRSLMRSDIQVSSNEEIREYLTETLSWKPVPSLIVDTALELAQNKIYSNVRDREIGDYEGPLYESGWEEAMARQIRQVCESKAKEIVEDAQTRYLQVLGQLGTELIKVRGANWAPSDFTQVSMFMAYSPDSERENCSRSNSKGCAIVTLITPVKCSLEVVVQFETNNKVVETVRRSVVTTPNRKTEVEFGRETSSQVDFYRVVSGKCT